MFTHHDRRPDQQTVHAELSPTTQTARLGKLTPHQLPHTYATALVNTGISPQALIAPLEHVSTEMSLHYQRLFDTTVRTKYEHALNLAKTRINPLPSSPTMLPLTNVTADGWRDTPTIKARMAGGYCLHAPAQEACPYTNIREHCPSYRTDTTHLPVLAPQHGNTEVLTHDTKTHG
ncbi:MAG: tyrosine-type recombinase/integrase [Pseudonocardia sp.]